MSQVRMHAGEDQRMVFMGDVGEPVADLAGVVVVHDGDGADRTARVGSVLEFDLGETVADEVADRLRAVRVAFPLDDGVEPVEQPFPDGHAEPDEIVIRHRIDPGISGTLMNIITHITCKFKKKIT